MSDHIKLAIGDLEQKLQVQLAGVLRLKSAINILSETIGEPAPYADISDPTSAVPEVRASKQVSIRADEFYGKPLSSAVRQVLALRKEANPDNGPATVDEIHQALKRGGFAFEARDEENQIRGLGVSISKNSALFARLPNASVGLAEWYDKKKPRVRVRAQTHLGGPGAVDAEGDDSADEVTEEVVAEEPQSTEGGP